MDLLRSPGAQQQWAGTLTGGQLNRTILLTHLPLPEATTNEAGLEQIFIEKLQSLLGLALSAFLYFITDHLRIRFRMLYYGHLTNEVISYIISHHITSHHIRDMLPKVSYPVMSRAKIQTQVF